ncbi:1-deoxy-D-xylulose-5-phosphate reductoisomerase [Bacillus horti]|uniref:1-deoxy-D-xylulose 5-phosphate reductoisomerase n=1 Tax=Caldalkalibacillus horti TaxID=77523 RepID=A0ABT9VUQ5_9BACI|nr:1-deoxy-D-xylulose-5-phosphate reductoisomerase [Bacillus horti]MDQ0164699.1 1-deoxy-D-xylulose-5-phosphate reductoisomerase [Bacillus horti]
MKYIAVLGSTGSVGTQTMDVLRAKPEHFKLVALAAGQNVQVVLEQIHEFRPALVSVATKEAAEQIKAHAPQGVKIIYGEEGLLEVVTYPQADVVVTAIVGSVGLKPTLAAIEAKKTIALANKETLVTAGKLVMEQARRFNVDILPVDSEHSAIFQCLQGENRKRVEQIIVTASGGSLRHKNRAELEHVTVQEVLNHPNWSMGSKITVDSATMMNKGLEVIEAHWLFDIPFDQIEVLQHDESIIHSMVVFEDSAVMAQLGTPDMKVPIQYALTYPDRYSISGKRLNLAEIGKLHFRKMDFERFPCLRMAYEAGRAGGTVPTVLNAANEVSVMRFLQGDISFLSIEHIISNVLDKHSIIQNPGLEDIHAADLWARELALSMS